MKNEEILDLASSHGLRLKSELRLNEMGIDFRVVFARDLDGNAWVLRIPRREGLAEQIEHEKKILDLVKKYLSVSVPDWSLAGPDLIAYPLLEDPPVLTFDPATYEVTWNIDQTQNQYVDSFSRVLCELHRIPVSEAAAAGLKVSTPEMARRELSQEIDRVKRELGMSTDLETRWRRWIETDSYWPAFSTFVHGDLYAGHVLSDAKGNISGIIDWSEAQVSDPSIDFAGHLNAFGEQSLRELITKYEGCGGAVWENMFEHILERHSASPLKYGIFALESNTEQHLKDAKAQLGAS